MDDETPQIISLPASQSETDPQWQENVLRNAAPTVSVHSMTNAGLKSGKAVIRATRAR